MTSPRPRAAASSRVRARGARFHGLHRTQDPAGPARTTAPGEPTRDDTPMRPGPDDGTKKPGGKPGRRARERRLAEYETGPASTPTWGEVRARLRARSALKGKRAGGGVQRAGPADTQDASVHDDRQGMMKEPSRRGPSRGGPTDRRPSRPRDDSDEPRRFSAPRTGGTEALLELADELEDQARSLMQQARRLQRLAQEMDRGESAPPSRPRGRTGGPERGGPRREGFRSGAREEERPRKRSEEEPRPRKRTGDGPAWTPKGKKRRP